MIHVLAMMRILGIVMDILVLNLEIAKQIAVNILDGKVVRVNAEICTNSVAINPDNL